jgi:hypothetical protein
MLSSEAAIHAACKELNYKLKENPQDKLNIAAVARSHSITYTTLRNRFRGHTKPRKAAHGCQQLVSPEQEAVLISWLKHLGVTGHPICKRTIKQQIQYMCKQKPGKNWIYCFLERNPDIVLTKPSGLDPKRARAFNRPSVQKYFDQLKHIVETHSIPSTNIYNMDEKGCQQGGGKKGSSRKYFYSRQTRAKYKHRSANLELVTIIECVCADGVALSPGFVFEGQQYDLE